MVEAPKKIIKEVEPRNQEVPPQIAAWTKSGLPISDREDSVFIVNAEGYVENGAYVSILYWDNTLASGVTPEGKLNAYLPEELYYDPELFFVNQEMTRVSDVKNGSRIKPFPNQSNGHEFEVRFEGEENSEQFQVILFHVHEVFPNGVDKRPFVKLKKAELERVGFNYLDGGDKRLASVRLESSDQGLNIVFFALTLQKTNSPTEEQIELKNELKTKFENRQKQLKKSAAERIEKERKLKRDTTEETDQWSPKELAEMVDKEELKLWEQHSKEKFENEQEWKQHREHFNTASIVFIEVQGGGIGDGVYRYLMAVQLAKLYPNKTFYLYFPHGYSTKPYSNVFKGRDCPKNLSFLKHKDMEKEFFWKKVKAFFSKSKQEVAYINIREELLPEDIELPENLKNLIELHKISFSKENSYSDLESSGNDHFEHLPEHLRTQWISMPLMINAMLDTAIPYPLPIEGFKELTPKPERENAGYDVVFVYDAASVGRAKVLSINQLLEAVAFCKKLNLRVGIVMGLTNPSEAKVVKNVFPEVEIIEGSIDEITDILSWSKVVVTVDTGFGHILQAKILATLNKLSPSERKSFKVPKILSLFGKIGFDPYRFFLPLARTLLGSKVAAQINQEMLNSSIEEAYSSYLAN